MKTIQMKLLAPILCAMLVGGLLTGYASYQVTSEVIIRTSRNDGQRTVHSVREFTDMSISAAQLELSSFAVEPALRRLLRGADTPHDLEEHMQALLERQALYNSITVLNGQGRIVASTSGSRGSSRADRDYFKAAMAGRHFVSPVETSRQTGRLVAFVSMPVRAGLAGEILGVVMAAVRVNEINTRYVVPVNLLEKYGFAMIVNREGLIICHGDASRLGKRIQDDLRRRLSVMDEESAVFEESVDGRPSLIFVERSRVTDWTSMVVCPIEDFYTATDALANVIGLLVGAIIALLALVVWLTVRGVTNALGTTIRYAVAVSRGELDMPLSVRREDEVGVLAQSLRDMVGALKNMIAVAECKTREAELLAQQATLATREAQHANVAKSDFLARMSHEMRTPMNAIIGMTTIAQSPAADLEKKNYCLDKVEGASKHLLGVINDILDMSKIEANKFELFPEEFSFEHMAQKVTDIINFRVEEKRQSFTVDIDPQIPGTLIGDEQRLAQVITNLLSNAVKFTPDGGKIHFAAHLVEKDPEGMCVLRVSVKDSGIGISAEQQARLFVSFTQADGGVARKFGGTGLGLAISKRIVEMMGGSIEVQSESGQGSVFMFSLRAMQGAENRQSLLAPGVNWNTIRVLMVDDDPSMREYFQELAQRIGIACDLAAGGEEACELLQRNAPYDICFVDWDMPGMNGIELSSLIKARATRPSIVIMVSSIEWSRIADDAQAAGVDRFIPKPLFASTIVDSINTCLGRGGALEHTEDASGDDMPSFAGSCLLLAEDVEINREIVQTLLEPTRIRVECAGNGREAVSMFHAAPEHYDLIFMDIHMPEMDGYEATRRIRSLVCPRALTVPIVAMTANAFREDVERCLEAGMNAHVSKPLDVREVLAVLHRCLTPGATE